MSKPSGLNAGGTAAIPGTSRLRRPYRSFQVVKNITIGLVDSKGFAVMINPSGGSSDTLSPAYHTSPMLWASLSTCLPPSFQLCMEAAIDIRKHDSEED